MCATAPRARASSHAIAASGSCRAGAWSMRVPGRGRAAATITRRTRDKPLPCIFSTLPMTPVVDAADLRRYAIARSLFAPAGLQAAIERLGFVQADPIRAPARAQDLALRHRVAGYSVGDLDRTYPALAVEEDFFVNYGFVSRDVYALMHPRKTAHRWSDARRRRARAVLAFVAAHGEAHPRE